jgi:O-antigen ligase
MRSLNLRSLALALLVATPAIQIVSGASGGVLYGLAAVGLLCAAYANLSRTHGIRVPAANRHFLVLTTILFMWLLAASHWTSAHSRFAVEVPRLFTLFVLVVLATLTLSISVVQGVLVSICAIGAFVGGYVVFTYVRAGQLSGYQLNISESYLTIAHLVGIGAVGGLLQFAVTRRLPWALTGGWLLVGMALSLARGALLSVLVIVCTGSLLVTFRGRGRKGWAVSPRRVALGGTIIVLLAGALSVAFRVERTRVRLLRLFSGREIEEGGRGELWTTAWRNIQEAPVFGHGLGSSGFLSAGGEAGYPHNLFLQVWLDGGIVAVLLLFAALCVPVLAGFRKWRRVGTVGQESPWVAFAGIYVFCVLEYSKSSNFYTARSLFLFAVCLIYSLSQSQRLFARPASTQDVSPVTDSPVWAGEPVRGSRG